MCKRGRARRCRRGRGRASCGYCAAQRETFCGWRLPLVCTTGGRPLAFTLLPGGFHDLTPRPELTVDRPAGAWVYGDKGDNSAAAAALIRATGGGVRVPLHKDNMRPNTRAAHGGRRPFRLTSAPVTRHLTALGRAQLHVRSGAGLAITVPAALRALLCLNADLHSRYHVIP